MARGEQNGADFMTQDEWISAMARRGYTVLDGKVYHGSGGHIAELPLPNWADTGVKSTLAQAWAEFVCNRHLQGAKAGEGQSIVNKVSIAGDVDASDDGDESKRTKIVEALIAKEITRRVKEKAPNATDAQIASTIAKYHDDVGRQIVAAGAYEVAKKKKGATTETGEVAEAIEL